jgi:hypothetical protein
MPGNATLLALPSLLTCVGIGIGTGVVGVGIEQTRKVATMSKNANKSIMNTLDWFSS